jgi:hypothetical protein
MPKSENVQNNKEAVNGSSSRSSRWIFSSAFVSVETVIGQRFNILPDVIQTVH